ncbi:metallophosphoesterase [Cellulomonas sp. PhB150]|uniref:metallophosphoesterase family protein n=1 Tax=Cellulomonas sp. PhB150 TaxID=2485188 RepID=UPI000F46BFA6|nr:metallophosphoesterase [Cellulomonas sp. PhB150]ROS31065.1 Icc-related predicted phosphoesterase [Cellulomonas sp. PhB150]
MSSLTSPGTTRTRRRWWPRILLGAVAVVASLVFGVTTASVEGSFGPHEARYDVTTDETLTVDLGPLGTLRIDSPLPLALGARITVQEIPASFDQLDQATTLKALTGDLNDYAQFFSAPEATVRDVARALVVDAVLRTLVALLVLIAGWFTIAALVGAARRDELAERVRPHERHLLVGSAIAAVVVLAASSGIETARRDAEDAPAEAVFAGTPLEGARVTGRLGGVIDTYGSNVMDAYRSNEAFYARADRALSTQWDITSDAIATQQSLLGGGQGDHSYVRAPAPDLVTLVVVSDLHCNVGMAPLITTLVERSGASLVLDAGDTTINGTSVEQYCVSTFARAIPDGVDLVTSPGNHDSAETSAMYDRAGAQVLGGEVVEVDGIRILGDRDPNETRLGQGTSAGVRTAEEEGADLAATACDDEDGVDLLLIHTPWVGDATLDGGCAPAQVSGHLHRRTGPEQIGEGIRYGSSSSAGATLNEPTVGPLKGTAEMTVLHWDPSTRRVVDYQVVQVTPDATARVLWPQAWPTIVVPPTITGTQPGAPSPV